MPSPRSLLLAFLLTVLQCVLSVDAKGGGKGSSSKGSKKKSKTKPKPKPIVYEENGRCYNEQRVEIKCPAKKNTALIVGIIVGVIVGILILILAIWFFKRRSQKKKKGYKSLDVKSRGIDDASSDHESIVPLVHGDTKEKGSGFGYKDRSSNV